MNSGFPKEEPHTISNFKSKEDHACRFEKKNYALILVLTVAINKSSQTPMKTFGMRLINYRTIVNMSNGEV